MNDKLRALVETMDSRFVSGNAIPVERTHITSDEWRAIRESLLPPSEAGEVSVEIFTEKHGVDLRGITVGRMLTQEQWDAVCAFVREQESVLHSRNERIEELTATPPAAEVSTLVGVCARMLTFSNSEYVPNTMFDQLTAALRPFTEEGKNETR